MWMCQKLEVGLHSKLLYKLCGFVHLNLREIKAAYEMLILVVTTSLKVRD